MFSFFPQTSEDEALELANVAIRSDPGLLDFLLSKQPEPIRPRGLYSSSACYSRDDDVATATTTTEQEQNDDDAATVVVEEETTNPVSPRHPEEEKPEEEKPQHNQLLTIAPSPPPTSSPTTPPPHAPDQGPSGEDNLGPLSATAAAVDRSIWLQNGGEINVPRLIFERQHQQKKELIKNAKRYTTNGDVSFLQVMLQGLCGDEVDDSLSVFEEKILNEASAAIGKLRYSKSYEELLADMSHNKYSTPILVDIHIKSGERPSPHTHIFIHSGGGRLGNTVIINGNKMIGAPSSVVVAGETFNSVMIPRLTALNRDHVAVVLKLNDQLAVPFPLQNTPKTKMHKTNPMYINSIGNAFLAFLGNEINDTEYPRNIPEELLIAFGYPINRQMSNREFLDQLLDQFDCSVTKAAMHSLY